MAQLRSKRTAAVAAGLLALTGGGGAAIAASQGSGTRTSFLDSVAKHLGVTPQALKDATKAAAVDQVEADLAAGRITEAEADRLKARIAAGDGVGLGGLGRHEHGGPGGPGGPGLRGILGDKLASAASYLGVTAAELRTQLRDGKSLADVAKAEGKSVDGLKAAIVDAAKAALDKAVTEQRITADERTRILEALQDRVGALVDGTFRDGRRHGPGGDRRAPDRGP